MRTLHSIIILAFIVVSFSSCLQPKTVTGYSKKVSIQNLLILPVYSQISVIEQKDERTISELLSSATEKEIKFNLEKYIPSDVNKTYLDSDDLLERKIIDTNIQLLKVIRSSIFPKKVKAPVFLLDILDSLHKDYGLFIFHQGFTRTSENLKTEYIKRRNIALFSLGLYDTEPNKSYSVMIGVIVDKKAGKVISYEESNWRDRDPNTSTVIRAQIRDIISSSFKSFE